MFEVNNEQQRSNEFCWQRADLRLALEALGFAVPNRCHLTKITLRPTLCSAETTGVREKTTLFGLVVRTPESSMSWNKVKTP